MFILDRDAHIREMLILGSRPLERNVHTREMPILERCPYERNAHIREMLILEKRPCWRDVHMREMSNLEGFSYQGDVHIQRDILIECYPYWRGDHNREMFYFAVCRCMLKHCLILNIDCVGSVFGESFTWQEASSGSGRNPKRKENRRQRKSFSCIYRI